VAIAARSPSLFGFLAVAPWLVAPLLAVPLAWAVFGLDVPPLRLVPTIGAWELLQAGYTPVPAGRLLADAAYLAAWTAGAFAVAVPRIAGAGNAGRPTAASALPRRRRARPPRRAPRGLVPAFIDAANAFRSPLTLALAASPLVLAAAVRFGLPPLQDWLWHAHGVRATGFQPLIFSGVILLHVPLHPRRRRHAAAAGRPRRGRAAGAVGVPARHPRLPVLPDRLHRAGRPLRRHRRDVHRRPASRDRVAAARACVAARGGLRGAGPAHHRHVRQQQGARVRGLESAWHRLLPAAGRLGAAPV